MTASKDFDTARFEVIGNNTLGEFNRPSGVAVDNKDNLYVADTGNNRIQIIDSKGNITSIGKQGSSLGEFNRPVGVALDNKGTIYVAVIKSIVTFQIKSDGLGG